MFFIGTFDSASVHIQKIRWQMTLTSCRAPGSANTHQTNYHKNDVYQAICLKLSMFVCIKLIANIR